MALQIAVLSTSRIVAEVMREIGNWPEVEVTAIVCRPQSAEKAHAWAAEYGVPAVYTDEAAAYAAGGFDAVYIGTANHLHYAAAKLALQAQKLAIAPRTSPILGSSACKKAYCGR